MLPNFLIIGAEKAATTWLAACLEEHPDVLMSRPKEVFFFSSRFHRGVGWYRSHFRDWSGQRSVGEATPIYLSHPGAPERIRATLGESRLIVSLRHPVDRAYSAFWHNLRQGRLPPDSDFRRCFGADACEIRSRGRYASHLERYLARFPRERLLTLVFEELAKDPSSALSGCTRFLGLEEFAPSAMALRFNEGGKDIRAFNRPARALRAGLRKTGLWTMRRRLVPRRAQRRLVATGRRAFNVLAYGWGPRKRPYEPLDRGLREALLREFYGDEIGRLEEMLDRDLSRWKA